MGFVVFSCYAEGTTEYRDDDFITKNPAEDVSLRGFLFLSVFLASRFKNTS
jgi:hypothetical protein